MDRRSDAPETGNAAPGPGARTIAITSGKGGVGKSNLALNLAIALQRFGHSTCLFDANFGLGNIDVLCGLCGYWNLTHVVSGSRSVAEITLDGPEGIHVVPGATGLLELADAPHAAQREVLAQLDELERRHEYLILDTGTGVHRAVRQFVDAAETVLVVATPEPTAIADAYAMLKSLSFGPSMRQPYILVNQADTPEQAREIIARVQQTALTFLRLTVSSAGFVPRDPAVPNAVSQRTPLLIRSPRSPAARAIEQLARRFISLSASDQERNPYFSRMAWRMERKSA